MKKLFFFVLIYHQALAQIEPNAGSWKTWVIASGKDHHLPAPPNAKATQAELKEVLNRQTKRDSAAIAQITYWNAGPPGYRWQQIADSLVDSKQGPRIFSLMNVAIYDATIAAWNAKYRHNRPRPSYQSQQVKTVIANPNSSSYPCEHAVTAGAAATVLGYLYPQKTDSLRRLAQQVMQSRVNAGVQYPSDVEAGYALGKEVAERVIKHMNISGYFTDWDGKTPDKPGIWKGDKPLGATMGSWKTWVLTSGSQFRPGPPPDFAKEMDELRQYKTTRRSTLKAFYWVVANAWPETLTRKLFEHNLDQNPPRAARAYALFSVAQYDANVSCWDAKYTYWGIRPVQYDTTYKPVLITTPPFPGYPSGHATLGQATATVLAYLFPEDATTFYRMAKEAAESRFMGGVHFRTDNEVGLEMGRKVGNLVVERARHDGADSLVGKPAARPVAVTK